MNVEVRLFAAARQLAGHDRVSLSLPAGATVADVRHELETQWPQLAPLLKVSLIAVNAEYAAEHQPVPVAGELAVIPPVSGG